MLEKEECIHYVRPVRDVLELLAGKWKVPLLVALAAQSRKFNELERLLAGITPRTLSKELKDLEVNELVRRIVCPTTPVTVEYSLTPYGNTFEDVIATLRNWGLTHRSRLLERTEPEQTPFVCGNSAG